MKLQFLVKVPTGSLAEMHPLEPLQEKQLRESGSPIWSSGEA
jgi:hypothetical protein